MDDSTAQHRMMKIAPQVDVRELLEQQGRLSKA
jgi:hypothetical protein